MALRETRVFSTLMVCLTRDNADFEEWKWCTGWDVAACIYSNMRRELSWGRKHQT